MKIKLKQGDLELILSESKTFRFIVAKFLLDTVSPNLDEKLIKLENHVRECYNRDSRIDAVRFVKKWAQWDNEYPELASLVGAKKFVWRVLEIDSN